MADTKISLLPSKTTVSPTDLVPLVDESVNPVATKQTPVSTLLQSATISPFVTRYNKSFMLKGQKFRFVGGNQYNLMNMSQGNVQAFFDSARKKGITVVRTWCYDPAANFRSLTYPIGTNLISNPSFETDTSGYDNGSGGAINGSVYARSTDTADDGTYSIKQTSNYNTYDFLSYLVTVQPNTNYVWTIWYLSLIHI